MSNSENFGRLLKRGDLDIRMQGAITELVRRTGLEYPWVTKFFDLTSTPEGEELLRSEWWIEFMEILEEQKPSHLHIPALQWQQCKTPRSDSGYQSVSYKSLLEIGSKLIVGTIELTLNLSSESKNRTPQEGPAEVADDIANLLVRFLEAKINPPDPYS
jgi:hypothetical protein